MDLVGKLHIGEPVELSVNGKFFERTDEEGEKYLGYVVKLTPYVVGLSVTPPSNKRHGYVSGQPPQAQHVVEVESVHIKDFRNVRAL